MTLLSVRDLRTRFHTGSGVVKAVDGVSFDLDRGQVLAIVGESGSGKSATALSLLGLLPSPSGRIESGSVRWKGQELVGQPGAALRRVRGAQMAMVFQDPMSSLNPVQRVGHQIAEMIRLHRRLSRRGALDRAVEMMDLVGIPHASDRVASYPHQFSGGMRQRVMIAMALSCEPDLLIADEPTTALDVTIQAQVLDVLTELKERLGTAILLITHDLGVVAGMADDVMVMYAGRVVERGLATEVFARPRHPYTLGLLASLPQLDRDQSDLPLQTIEGRPPSLIDLPAGCSFHPRCSFARLPEPCAGAQPELRWGNGSSTSAACHLLESATPGAEGSGLSLADLRETPERFPARGAPSMASPDAGERLPTASSGGPRPLLEVRDLVKHFAVRGGLLAGSAARIHAVCGVSFDVHRGQTFGVVGESGCGKSTVARLVLRLVDPTSGSVTFDGKDVFHASRSELRHLRGRMQMVFQDPVGSLNPRMTVRAIVSEPLHVHGRYRPGGAQRVEDLLEQVGLDVDHSSRYPHQFSGGQRQRIGIARALALDPALLVLDEPLSALDVSIRSGVVNLLEQLQDRLGLAYVLIAHDLSVVRHIADRVGVMYLGKIVELGTRDDVFLGAAHPYTQALLSAVPVPDPAVERSRRRIVLTGDVPSPIDPPSGCRFRTRCPKAEPICRDEEPALVERGQGHPVACHFAGPL